MTASHPGALRKLGEKQAAVAPSWKLDRDLRLHGLIVRVLRVAPTVIIRSAASALRALFVR
jgi:hypothetical protein